MLKSRMHYTREYSTLARVVRARSSIHYNILASTLASIMYITRTSYNAYSTSSTLVAIT